VPYVQYLAILGRRVVETVGSMLHPLFPRRIHAVTPEGFALKVFPFFLAHNLRFIAQKIAQVATWDTGIAPPFWNSATRTFSKGSAGSASTALCVGGAGPGPGRKPGIIWPASPDACMCPRLGWRKWARFQGRAPRRGCGPGRRGEGPKALGPGGGGSRKNPLLAVNSGR